MRTGLMLACVLFAVGETLGDATAVLGPVSEISAVVVLAWVAYSQRQEIQALRARHSEVIDRLCTRWDTWEQLRHADSDKLNATLGQVREHCASVLGRGAPVQPPMSDQR